MFRSIKANPKLAGAQTVVYVFMIAAATVSAIDIVHLAEKYGVPAPVSWTAPVFIDGLAWLGKIGRSRDFLPETRRAGLKLMALGGLLSLLANVTVGATIGLKVYGALVVTGFIIAEWYSAKLDAKPAEEEAPAPVELTRGQKAAITRKANQAKAVNQARGQQAAATRKRNAEIKAMAAGFVPVNAPISAVPATS